MIDVTIPHCCSIVSGSLTENAEVRKVAGL